MKCYIVTAKKLHKRSSIPDKLPCVMNIAGIVRQGFTFYAQEVTAAGIDSGLGSWFTDAEGNFYWGGGIAPLEGKSAVLSSNQVEAATGAHKQTAERFIPYLADTCKEFSINTPVRQLSFLAQIGHESGGLFYTEELDSGWAYEGRHDLGNTHPEDGIRYKGRGLIQITGRNNYQWLSNSFKVDFVNSPEKLGGKNASACSPEQIEFATRSAGWFWKNNELNAVADRINLSEPIDEGANLEIYRLLTRKINGGYNGLNDRISKFQAGLQFFI